MSDVLTFRRWVKDCVVLDEEGAYVACEVIGCYHRAAWQLDLDVMPPEVFWPKWNRWLKRHRIGRSSGKIVGVSFIRARAHQERIVAR